MSSLRYALALCFVAFTAQAADYPPPKEADWVAHDFRFHDGATMADLKLHYTTVGDPAGEPVLILHGTAGSGTGMLTPEFAGALFGPGQPLDARHYFIILPDAIGAGQSSKPSDDLRARFPHYDYADMVQAQHRLVTEGLGLHHLRLVLGNSMGGMLAWQWAVTYPQSMDAVVPMASQPTAMAGRNWMLRRMLIESIRQDPDYRDGDYEAEPRSLRLANVLFGLATNGGTLAYQAEAPTHGKADEVVDGLLAAPAPADANDYLYQWDASRDYDPEPKLGLVEAPVLAINSADDERNPPETGVEAAALGKVRDARLLLIAASAETRGHATTGLAKFWAEQLRQFLDAVPQRGM